MNIHQYNAIKAAENPATTSVSVDTISGEDRTLLYGYTAEHRSFHVYLRDRLIHRVIYDTNSRRLFEPPLSAPSVAYDELIPNKLYPESCDAAFAAHLDTLSRHHKGYGLRLVPFDQDRYDRVQDLTFHGLLAEYLT